MGNKKEATIDLYISNYYMDAGLEMLESYTCGFSGTKSEKLYALVAKFNGDIEAMITDNSPELIKIVGEECKLEHLEDFLDFFKENSSEKSFNYFDCEEDNYTTVDVFNDKMIDCNDFHRNIYLYKFYDSIVNCETITIY